MPRPGDLPAGTPVYLFFTVARTTMDFRRRIRWISVQLVVVFAIGVASTAGAQQAPAAGQGQAGAQGPGGAQGQAAAPGRGRGADPNAGAPYTPAAGAKDLRA